jgi:hypothetical protein
MKASTLQRHVQQRTKVATAKAAVAALGVGASRHPHGFQLRYVRAIVFGSSVGGAPTIGFKIRTRSAQDNFARLIYSRCNTQQTMGNWEAE